MVTLPEEFVATRFSGYFWNIKDQRLYSIKVTGELKPLKHIKPNYFNRLQGTGGYRVSVRGYRRILTDEYSWLSSY